jgi:rhodanese-related sulfurtransferase
MSTPEMDVEEGRRRFAAGALLLDVREPNEWDAGHVEGARWIPLGDLAARYEELPRDREIVVICRSGGRSAKATDALVQLGFSAMNLAGGTQAWAEHGHPLVAADGSPGEVA